MEPRYVRIAIDIATSIERKELLVGTKISGRSVLSSRYNVSPETIRKAISLLKEYDVVSSKPKSGIVILNEENASLFLKDIQLSKDYNDIKTEVQYLLDEQSLLNLKMKTQLKLLLELPNKPKHFTQFFPYELAIPATSHLDLLTISESSFWQNTGATIVSVLHKDKNYISPGPDFKLKTEDIISFVCKDSDYDRTRSFIEKRK